MEREGYYKKLFFVGALWNWGATVPLFFFYGFIFTLLGEKVPVFPVWLQLFLALAFVFGIGYYWVSKDLSRVEIVKMGAIGKILVFIIPLYYAIRGDIGWIVVGIVFVDLVFAVLFIEFLLRVRKSVA